MYADKSTVVLGLELLVVSARPERDGWNDVPSASAKIVFGGRPRTLTKRLNEISVRVWTARPLLRDAKTATPSLGKKAVTERYPVMPPVSIQAVNERHRKDVLEH